MKKLFITVALAASCVAAQVHAETTTPATPTHKADKKAIKLDANNDQKISKSEYLANAERRFNKLDADKDGVITKAEMAAKKKRKKSKAN